MDDGADPHPATGPPPRRGIYLHRMDEGRTVGLFTAQEALDPGNWRSAEPSREPLEAPGEHSRRRRRPRQRQRSPAPPMAADPDVGTRPAPSWESSAYRVVVYDRETGMDGHYTQEEINRFRSAPSPSHHCEAEGAGTATRVRQSVLYSDRPRRAQHRHGPAPAVEHPSVVRSSEIGTTVLDLPTFEAMSLSDPPVLTPETAEETDDDEAYYYDGLPRDVGQSALYSYCPKGFSISMVLSLGDSLIKTVSTAKKKSMPDSNDDVEEELRLCREYYAARPKNFWEAIDEAKAAERATCRALAAECGLQPPSEHAPVDQEVQSLQAPQEASSATADPQLSMAQRKPRHEASMEETIRSGKKWMRDEVMLCFKKYVERCPDLVGLVNYDLDELCHQCFNVESYNKVYHHYNFRVRMKMPSSNDWATELYFAEVKEIFGRKYYLCYPLEPNENGHCYACKNQGVEDLRHPAIGVFEMGSLDAPACNLWYTDE